MSCCACVRKVAASAPLRTATTAVPFEVSACFRAAVCFTRPHGLTKRPYLLVSTRHHLLPLCSRTLLVMYGQTLTTKHMPQVSTRVKLLLCLSIP